MNQQFHFPATSFVMANGAANAPMYIYFDGNAQITASFIYYTAT